MAAVQVRSADGGTVFPFALALVLLYASALGSRGRVRLCVCVCEFVKGYELQLV